MNIWQILEIPECTDRQKIRSAYAKKLIKCNPEVDPEGFQQLRIAYEKALQYAKQPVEVGSEAFDETEKEKFVDQHADRFEIKSDALAFSLLNELYDSPNTAIEKLESFKLKGYFDNLEFADSFQYTLATNLLASTVRHYHFIAYCAEIFKWHDQATRETFYGLVLTNLLNQVRPYQFLNNLHYLKNIKNKKAAKAEKIKWEDCCAARNVLGPVRSTFFLTRRFNRKVSLATYALIEKINAEYREIIGVGLNLYAYIWWDNARRRWAVAKIKKPFWPRSPVHWLFILIFIFNIFKVAMTDISHPPQHPHSSASNSASSMVSWAKKDAVYHQFHF